jgi:hypothetical protein
MIVGFNIDSLDANKTEKARGNLQINYRPKIEDVEKATVNAFDDEVARIEFTFTVDYQSNGESAAQILMEGNVLWKGNTDELVEKWEEDETLHESVEAPLMNDLYRKLLSEAVGVANTLSLLPPIPTPQVNKGN